jgi:hypothetical protein
MLPRILTLTTEVFTRRWDNSAKRKREVPQSKAKKKKKK